MYFPAYLLNLLFAPLLWASDVPQLPAAVKVSIEKALATNDIFIIDATKNAVKAQYPQFITEISAIKKPTKPAATKLAITKKIPEEVWTGNMEGSFQQRSGNTKTQELKGEVKLQRETNKWRNNLATEGRYATENKQRINEDYRLRLGSDYKLSDNTFLFAEAEYVTDKFSGFDYRITESFGGGYRWKWGGKKMVLDLRGSAGARHFKDTSPSSNTQHEAVLKPAAHYTWQVRDGFSFEQNVNSIIGGKSTITESESNFIYKVNSKLDIKVAFELEHTSSVPSGTKKLETYTSTGLVYKIFE